MALAYIRTETQWSFTGSHQIVTLSLGSRRSSKVLLGSVRRRSSDLNNLVLNLTYGGAQHQISIPAESLLGIPRAHDVPEMVDSMQAIARSLADPIGVEPLKDLLPWQRVASHSADQTRPMPLRMIVTVILNELNLAGLRNDSITIVLALGSSADDPSRD